MTPDLEAVIRLCDKGIAEQNLGHPARALQHQTRALRALEQVPPSPEGTRIEIALLISVGLNRAELQDVDDALATVDDALRRAEAAGQADLAVKAHSNSALIALRVGRLDEAIRRFELAERRLAEGQPIDQFATLLNLGVLRMDSGDLQRGHRALTAAVSSARSSGIELGEYKARHNLAYLDFLRGDLPGALGGMDEAWRLGPDPPLGVALLDRARVLLGAGLVWSADAVLADAASTLRSDRLSQDVGEVEVERARCALLAGDVDAARLLAAAARTRFRRRGNRRWQQSAELVLLQADLAAGRPGRRLIAPAQRLRDDLAQEGLHTLSRTASLIATEAALAAGDLAVAHTELARVGVPKKADPIGYRLHAGYVRARFEARSDHRSAASAQLRRGLEDLAAYQASFGSLELSTAAAVHGRRLVALDLELAIGSGRAQKVFAAAERGRAVTSRLVPVRPPEDPVTAELLADLRQTVESLRGVELDAARAAPLAKRRSELEAEIAQRAWARPGARMVTASASLGEVQGALADRSLAEYVVSGEELGAIVITGQSAAYVPLGSIAPVRELVRRARADLDVLAQPRLPAPIAAAVRTSFDHTVTALDDQVIRPLGLGGRLVLVTTGLLGQVPWGTLPSLRGVPLVVAPSASAWLAASSGGARRRGARLVSVAGPGLLRATEEASEVAAQWGSDRVLSGAAATGAALSKAMASARVVHIAAHGVHQNENPLFSSIRLADGPLFAHELDQAAGTPEHVVLSACELGLATVRPGDEALGLTSVLLRLGTRSVVAGVARIGDDLAAETMSTYHRLLAAGQDSAAALAEATGASTRPVPIVAFGAEWTLRSRR